MNGKVHALRGGQDAFFAAVLEHALACFGSRILHPSRAPFRDADLEELHELTCEDLERQASLKVSPCGGCTRLPIVVPAVGAGKFVAARERGLDAGFGIHRAEVGVCDGAAWLPAGERFIRCLSRRPSGATCAAAAVSGPSGRAGRGQRSLREPERAVAVERSWQLLCITSQWQLFGRNFSAVAFLQ